MNLREFAKECVSRGFQRNGDSFYRCIGDGVFQMLYIGTKNKLLPDHPLYSKTHRFERGIQIYLKTVYGMYQNEDGKNIDDPLGLFLHVHELDGVRGYHRFEGESAEYERMCAVGFDILDTLDTQVRLEKFLFNCLNPNKNELEYEYQLFELFLRCGEDYKARMAVETLLAQNCFAQIGNYRDWKTGAAYFPEDQQIRENSVQEYMTNRLSSRFEQYYERHCLTGSANRERAEEWLENNKARNIVRLRELGIDVSGL